MIKRYEHPEYGDLYRVWQGADNNNLDMDMDFSVNRYLAWVDGKFLVVGQSLRCSECDGESGRSCTKCNGYGWYFIEGPDFSNIGEPVEVRKIQPPSEDYLSQYESA